MQPLPSFLPSTFRVADLALMEYECTAVGTEERQTSPWDAFSSRFLLFLFPPFSLFSSFPLVWIAFALDGIAITKDGMEGFPPSIPTLLSRRSGVIAKGEDHVALKGILVVSVFSLFA